MALTREAFMAASKGLSAWTVARMLGEHCPGVDFRGSSRGRMADHFASGGAHGAAITDRAGLLWRLHGVPRGRA